jgi:hypothetical protein
MGGGDGGRGQIRIDNKQKGAGTTTVSALFSSSAWAGQFSIKLKQLVVPRAVNAAVRMDTTTWMIVRHRSLFFMV